MWSENFLLFEGNLWPKRIASRSQGCRDIKIKRVNAIKWVVAKLPRDRTASFCRRNEWSRSCRVTNQRPNLPWNLMTLGFLDPFAFPEQLIRTKSKSKRKTDRQDRTGVFSGPVRDTPPYRAIPFRDSIAEGGIAPICLVFIGYRASIAEIPLLRGGIAPPLRMLSKGELLRKGGGGIAPLLAMLRHQKPHSAQ